jgi:hypothetical protein
MQLKHIKGPGYSLNTHLHPTHYPRVHLLNHASEFTSHERYDRVRRQGAGHIRCKAERHIVTDSIRRRRGWQGESVSFLQRLYREADGLRTPRNQLFLAQQFKIKVSNNLTDFGLAVVLFIDGCPVEAKYLPAGMSDECSGVYESSRSIVPCKFHRQRVGTFVFLSSVQLPFDVRRKTQA